MTASYDVEQQAAGDEPRPSLNAEGHQVWNPSVGIHFKPAAHKAESYGGIIGALQDLHVRSAGMTKAYPENFAGIIAAIQDLGDIQYKPGSDADEKPPGGDIIIDIDGNPIWIITEKPKDGQLWFDTRQGRLFVWVEDDWYQTNGADGIPIITDDASPPGVEQVVPGQFWWDATHGTLYIFDGQYELPNGSITPDPNVGGTPVWRLVADTNPEGFIQNTGTLPLAAIGPKLRAMEDFTYLPDIDISPEVDGEGNITFPMSVQKDYNEWLFEALVSLNNGLEDHQPVYIGETPPPNTLEDPLPAGTLWYDTEALELSIWYLDDNSGQWVPTSVAYSYDDDIAALRASVQTETRLREQGLHNLQEKIEAFNAADAAEVTELEQKIAAVDTAVKALVIPDVSGFVTEQDYNVGQHAQNERIHALETAAPDYALLMSRSEVESELDTLEQLINSRASVAQVQEVAGQIPDVSGFVTQQHIDDSISNITVDYLPRSGGTVDGSFVIQKTDYDEPAFDFSSAAWTSSNAFKFRTNGPVTTTAQFGTNSKPWEYAWDFSSEEDFCWVYNNANKVFSITKEGPACSTLYLGDFQPNNNNGRVISNKIDVKERLNAYQSAFEQMRQGVNTATDFDSLKANILSALANV